MSRRVLPAGLLLFALAISIFLHGLVLLVPDFRLPLKDEPQRLIATLQPLPEKLIPSPALSVSAGAVRSPGKKTSVRKKPVHQPVPPVIAESLSETTISIAEESIPIVETATYTAENEHIGSGEINREERAITEGKYTSVENAPLRLPTQGTIHYRVDKGDSNFEVGRAVNHWRIVADRYHLFSVVETTGLIWLFKSLHIEMESKGRISQAGLHPETFVIRHQGKTIREWALFDWEKMKVQVGDQSEMDLLEGTQDLLSFNFQLGFVAQIDRIDKLPIVTGKKYREYGVQVVGKEEIELPAGILQAIHIRAPGENMTELWLAYDYLFLPVKIRHVDKKGNVLVQVATAILLGNDAEAFD